MRDAIRVNEIDVKEAGKVKGRREVDAWAVGLISLTASELEAVSDIEVVERGVVKTSEKQVSPETRQMWAGPVLKRVLIAC